MADKSWGRAGIPALSLLAALAAWETVCFLFKIDPWTLPAPSRILERMGKDAELLGKHVLSTLELALMGIGLGVSAGVAVALLLHRNRFLRATFSPLLIVSQLVPLIALGPLLMIWFGFGLTPKLILLTLVCFFPVAWSMMAGLGQAEPQLREYLAMIGASRWETLRRLELPASLPYFFSGLKISVTYSVTTAVVAEWLGGGKGIGYYLVLKGKGYDTAAVFGAILCIILLSLLLYGLVAGAESRLLRWRRPRAAGRGGGVSA